ncbi:hypothetical protein A3765_28555 [Oleiphilus sp. HI0130]|nr:hypothetical protein A3765_28840 [Oleiphilus sp. HI0130]KZZ72504.1 hypothetical protein A3765_28555 [Oleiphilus sp. HI0130]
MPVYFAVLFAYLGGASFLGFLLALGGGSKNTVAWLLLVAIACFGAYLKADTLCDSVQRKDHINKCLAPFRHLINFDILYYLAAVIIVIGSLIYFD